MNVDSTANSPIASISDKVLKHRPPRIAMALLAVAASVHLLVPIRLTYIFSSVTVAIIAGVCGFVVMMWAWWQFKHHKVAICPTDATDHLIFDGVYRFTRNPMYLGMILMLIGAAILFGTLPFYGAAIAYFAIINWVFCPYEEDKLATAFGREYETYRSQVRRWF